MACYLSCCLCPYSARDVIATLMRKKKGQRLNLDDEVIHLYFCLLTCLDLPGLDLRRRHVRLLDVQGPRRVHEFVSQYAEQVVPREVLVATVNRGSMK